MKPTFYIGADEVITVFSNSVLTVQNSRVDLSPAFSTTVQASAHNTVRLITPGVLRVRVPKATTSMLDADRYVLTVTVIDQQGLRHISQHNVTVLPFPNTPGVDPGTVPDVIPREIVGALVYGTVTTGTDTPTSQLSAVSILAGATSENIDITTPVVEGESATYRIVIRVSGSVEITGITNRALNIDTTSAYTRVGTSFELPNARAGVTLNLTIRLKTS